MSLVFLWQTEVYNTTEPDVVDGFCVMPVTCEVQTVAPELCEPLELLDVMPVLITETEGIEDEEII